MFINNLGVHLTDYKKESICIDNGYVCFTDTDGVRISMSPEIIAMLQNLNDSDLKNKSVWDLELTVRATNVFKAAGIDTIGQLCELTPRHLKRMPNLGDKTYKEIVESLHRIGMSLNHERP